MFAVVIKAPSGLKFQPPEPADLKAMAAAEKELARLRPSWERENIIPTERIPIGDKTGEPLARGFTTWADLFTPRQLLCKGVLVEELRKLRREIVSKDGSDLGEAVVHLLAFVIDKLTNYNSGLSFWHSIRSTMANTFDRHDFSFKPSHAEMAVCHAGGGLTWAVENVASAYAKMSELPRSGEDVHVEANMGSATSLPHVASGSITAIVVDPPYADNVQYSASSAEFVGEFRLG